jgi:hypothetical protein
VFVFNRIIAVAGQNADTQLFACAQLVLVEVFKNLKTIPGSKTA